MLGSIFKSRTFSAERHGFLAWRADAAHKALRAGKDDGGRNKNGRCPFVKTRDGPGVHCTSVLRTDGRSGPLDGDLGGFGVADFTDHDNVRVLAEDERRAWDEGRFLFGREPG